MAEEFGDAITNEEVCPFCGGTNLLHQGGDKHLCTGCERKFLVIMEDPYPMEPPPNHGPDDIGRRAPTDGFWEA